jgi:hypothetical protein
MKRPLAALLLPLAAVLLSGCAEPPASSREQIAVPGGCENDCAAGFRWAAEREVTDAVKCRGESGFADGCRLYVTWQKPH